MKKSRIISVILVVAMVVTMSFGTCSIAFAGEDNSSFKPAVGERVEMYAAQNSAARIPGPISGEINAKTILNTTYSPASYKAWIIEGGYYYLFQVNPKYTGILYLDAAVSGPYGLTIGEYVEVDGVPGYQNSMYVSGGGEGLYGEERTNSYGINVTAGKPCYILVQNEFSVPMDISLRGHIYTTGTRTLPSGTSKWTVFSGKNASGNTSTTWFKVTPQTTGTMIVSLKEFGDSYSTGYVTLYNSSKKSALSDKVYYNSNNPSDRVYFGVKKGTTYYLKVTGCYGSYSDSYKLGIKYSVTARTERALGYKSNAKKLYRGADATNTLFVASTSNNTDWYKIYVSSKRTTQFNINTSGIKTGTIFVYVYRGSKQIGSKIEIKPYSNGGTYSITYGTTYGKANSGTYYIKVVKGTKANGKYSIRYVK